MTNGRFAAASDPGQEAAFPLPRVISPEAAREIEADLRIEMMESGFTGRQVAEAAYALRGYAALTQEWNRQHHRAVEAEQGGEGFRAATYDLLLEARRTGAKVREPKLVDRKAVQAIRAQAAQKHEKVTKKITGNWFVMACAVLLKAFLLLPLANRYLLSVLPDADATRSIVALVLAATLAYTLTFVARYLVQVGVGMFAPEDGPHRRSVADILRPKANRTMFIVVLSLFVVVLGAFLSFDFVNAGQDGVGVIGLTFLFVAILLVFEMFLAYKLATLQDEEPEAMMPVEARYVAALHRADNETDLAKLRTLALNAEADWHRFLTVLDSGRPRRWTGARRKAMRLVRGMMGTANVETVVPARLNGHAVVALERPEVPLP